jgi:hypothetical protein
MTAVLAVLPCFMSHFIWAQTLAVVLFFPAFYALERAGREPAWAIVAAVAVGAVGLSQPSAAAVFGAMALLYWLVNAGYAALSRGRLFAPRALVRQAAAAAGGLLIAAAFYVPEYVKFGYDDFMFGIGKIPPGVATGGFGGTSSGITYDVWQYVWAPTFRNKINQPTGIGPALFVALAAGVVLLLVMLLVTLLVRPKRLREYRWAVVALLWLVFGVLGVEGNRFPVSLFPHRFWVFLAIPVAMIAGEFFAWVASALDWKTAATAVALALAIGGIVVFSGVAERLCIAVEDVPGAPPWSAPAGAPLGLLLLSLLLAAAALAALIYRLTRPSDAPESPGTRALALAGALLLPVLIAGVVVTSGYGKTLIQGFTDWQPGVRFYVSTAVTADGRRVAVQQHLKDYLFIHDNFPHDSRILIVNGPDDYLTGFDMFALPYDREIRLMRGEVLSAAPGDLNAQTLSRIIDLARAKKFDYLLVDHYWAADHQYYAGTNQRSIEASARAASLSERRFGDLLFGGAQPTEEEKLWVERIRPFLEGLRVCREKESREVERARRLRDLMRRSSALVPILDREPFAVAVFRIKPPP